LNRANSGASSNHLTDALELLRHALVHRHDLVKCVGDLPLYSEMIAAHSN
jgi:hypothetical protein